MTQKEASFEDEMIDLMNKASLALMISVGHRTQLFDKMASLTPSSTQQIADKANLNERYVREWLGAMVTGGVVDYDSEKKLYSFSKEKAEVLTRKTQSYNFAAAAQWIPALAQVEDQIVDCFEKGGGVPYSSYQRFHEVMEEESSQTVLPALVDKILPLASGLVDNLKKGISVLDVGCGNGRAVNLMAQNFPNSKFVGYDFSDEAIKNANTKSSELEISNASFEVKDVTEFASGKKFDLITAFDAIHDQANPSKVLKNIAESLKPDGVFLMQDIAASSDLQNNINHPTGPFLYTISCLHCMTVSLALNGAGLGTVWGKEKATQMLKEAGFSKIEVKELPHDFQNYYYIATK